jgi:hypothetical protein
MPHIWNGSRRNAWKGALIAVLIAAGRAVV